MTRILSPDDIIYSYTRQQAIEDGVLVDVSTTRPRRQAYASPWR